MFVDSEHEYIGPPNQVHYWVWSTYLIENEDVFQSFLSMMCLSGVWFLILTQPHHQINSSVQLKKITKFHSPHTLHSLQLALILQLKPGKDKHWMNGYISCGQREQIIACGILIEEEAYGPLPKWRPLKRPCHLRGLGLGLGGPPHLHRFKKRAAQVRSGRGLGAMAIHPT
jgi:hypothetical protein